MVEALGVLDVLIEKIGVQDMEYVIQTPILIPVPYPLFQAASDPIFHRHMLA